MRRVAPLLVLGAVLFSLLTPPATTSVSADFGFSVSFGFFHRSLQPYGRWLYLPAYGSVWSPYGFSSHWQPYCDGGFWANTEFGWTWVSDYDWGYIPFHYGAWTVADSYGWVWVPGYVWAPAWVTWSYSPRYIGWAPLPPSFVCPSSGYYSGLPVFVSHSQWVFVDRNYIGSRNIFTSRVDPRSNFELLGSSRQVTAIGISNEHVINGGPRVREIEQVAQTQLKQAKLEQLNLRPQPIPFRDSIRQFAIVRPLGSEVLKETGGPRREGPTASYARSESFGHRMETLRAQDNRNFRGGGFENEGLSMKNRRLESVEENGRSRSPSRYDARGPYSTYQGRQPVGRVPEKIQPIRTRDFGTHEADRSPRIFSPQRQTPESYRPTRMRESENRYSERLPRGYESQLSTHVPNRPNSMRQFDNFSTEHTPRTYEPGRAVQPGYYSAQRDRVERTFPADSRTMRPSAQVYRETPSYRPREATGTIGSKGSSERSRPMSGPANDSRSYRSRSESRAARE